MDDVGRLWVGVVICVIIVAVMAFFSACENAAVEFNDAKLRKLAGENKKGMRLQKMLEQPSRLVTANLISRSIMIIIISVTCTIYFFKPISDYLSRVFNSANEGVEYYAACLLSFLIISCVLTLVITVLGINLPKKLCLAGKIGDNFILSACGIYKLWLSLFKPLEIVNNLLSKFFLMFFGVKNFNKNDSVTEEEILMMVDAVNETGGIEESQAEMISNIFEFDDLEVREIMTHRTEVVAIDENSDVEDAVKLAIKEGFSRIPVYSDNVDNICGVVFAKDLLRLVFDKTSVKRPVKEYMRDIRFVPESNNCKELFKEFTEQKMQIAVAVDEYGGTAGIITMEDLLESIVGNIQDEYDNEDEEIMQISENSFDLLGTADYDDVMEALGKEPDEDSGFETIGGMVIDILGYIPKEGETPSVHWENIDFNVLKVQDKKIEKIRAVINNEDKELNEKD